MRHSDTICLSWLPQAATDEYIEREDVHFQEAAELLLRGLDPLPEQSASAAANALRLGEPARSPLFIFASQIQLPEHLFPNAVLMQRIFGYCSL